jgi:hypothetical protein
VICEDRLHRTSAKAFSSVVKFIEEVFGLPCLTSRDSNSNDMFNAFNLAGTPVPPTTLLCELRRPDAPIEENHRGTGGSDEV